MDNKVCTTMGSLYEFATLIDNMEDNNKTVVTSNTSSNVSCAQRESIQDAR